MPGRPFSNQSPRRLSRRMWLTGHLSLLTPVTALLLAAGINGWSWVPAGRATLTDVTAQARLLPEAAPIRGRVLFVSPHPDDETLAAAGIIQDVLGHGGQVDVVFLTNGDGFTWDARATRAKPVVNASDMLALGRVRQQEALAATAKLGVTAHHVHFLGFPDKGLSAIVQQTPASGAFTSPFTRVDHVPYSATLEPGAPYTREALERLLGQVIEQTRPQVILAPSVQDHHPDHQAAGLLTERLLARTPASGQQARLYAYLIHGGVEWPLPKGVHPDLPLSPPQVRSQGALWNRYPVTPEQARVKAQAIGAYRTQTRLIGRFMSAFIRQNELLLPRPGTPEYGAQSDNLKQ